MPYEDTRRRFADHIKSLVADEAGSKGGPLTAGELTDLCREWVRHNRRERAHSTRRTYCSGFAAYRVGGNGGKLVAD